MPTRFPTGLTNTKNKPLSECIVLDPTTVHTYFNDFDDVAAFNSVTDTASWDIDVVGAGSIALADGDGGRLLITNAGADNDRIFAYKKGESFKFVAGKELWFKAKFKVSSATYHGY